MPGPIKPKPQWLKMRIPKGERFQHVRHAIRQGELHTVCQEANCPNLGECWEAGTATFMILGDTCTRGCRFCAVGRGDPAGVLDETEPERVARAVQSMGLDYAVITSVTRDDLPDGGASVFAATVRALRALPKPPLVELLTPDYAHGDLRTVLDAGPDVLAHNIEVVEALTAKMRHRLFTYENSLRTLAQSKAHAPGVLTKSSIMLGIGETDEQLEGAMNDLRRVGVDILVLGQYLQPTRAHAPVESYVHPDRFDALAERGRSLGFSFVAAGPLVRTSYKAAEAYAKNALTERSS